MIPIVLIADSPPAITVHFKDRDGRFGPWPSVCIPSGEQMPCLFVIFLVAFPRIALLLMFFFSNYLDRAYHGLLIPLLGFLFLPLTTIVYAWMLNTAMALTGTNLIILLIAVLVDIGGLSGGEYHRRRW